MRIRNAFEEIVLLALYSIACSKRSDSGERCEVKKAMKSRGDSPSFLLRTAPRYLNAPLSELLEQAILPATQAIETCMRRTPRIRRTLQRSPRVSA